ncbi:MAG: efflux RND transporter periplasmic adaptor subunit [Maribacter sp.]
MKKGPGKQEQKDGPEPENTIATVQEVTLSSLPYRIAATGTLEASEKIELFSEVQGALKRTKIPFKEGSSYRKGSTIIHIDASEFSAQLKSNKSSLVNQIAAMLPDMEMEYPEAARNWENYLLNFDMEAPLKPLPEFRSEAERLFVIGKNITQTYYNTANQQERLAKYYINAPFSGVLSEANVNVGALVRSGQKLGSLVDTSLFELRLSIPASQTEYLRKGQKVSLNTLGGETEFQGSVVRINPIIDQNTQTINVFVNISDKTLRDGQYLQAAISGEEITEVYTVSSDLLTENDNLYVVKDSVLVLQNVTPINYLGDSIVVKGLKDGQFILGKPIAKAYPGMKVIPEKR